MNKRDKWLAERKKGIGGSEIAGILGLDKFHTPFSIWENKTGRRADWHGDNDTRRGNYLEPAIAAYYEKESGQRLYNPKNEIFYHKTSKIARVTPDRLLVNDKRKAKGVWEGKSLRYRIDKADIPKPFYIQTTWAAGVIGVDECIVAWLASMDFGYIQFELDKSFFQYLLEKAEEFWSKFVIKDTPPPPINTADIQAIYRKSIKGKIVKADKRLLNTHADLAALRELKKGLSEDEEKLENKIKIKMADAELLMDDDRVLCKWLTSDSRQEFDEAAFAKKHPLIYKKFLIEKEGSRRFYVKD